MTGPAVIELRGIGLPDISRQRPGTSRLLRRPGQHLHSQHLHSQHLHSQQLHTQPPDDQLPDDLSASRSLLDLTAWPGELVTLTGPAGSGKSALLGVIGLLDRPAMGSYLLNGLSTARLGDRDRAALRGRQIGMQFQRPDLLPQRSALDNVALPLRYADLTGRQRRITAFNALDVVGMASQAQFTIAQLSAAQRRLVAIARALVADPGLLLFDDPTANLDQATAAHVTSLLVGLCREGKTVLVATDDQLTAAYSSQRVTMARW